MTLKFVACLLVATLVSTVIAVPYRKPEFAEFTGEVKKGKFEGDVEEKRAFCSDVRDAYYCFLESVYENACDLNASQMKLKCASTCGFC